MKDKWFYPLQEEIKLYLKKYYTQHTCNYQEITKNRVFELYTCICGHDDISGDKSVDLLLFEMRKYPVRSDWFIYKFYK